MLLTDVGIYDV